MNPWPAGKNNGGATAQGVTKDSVKAIIYIENQQQAAAGSGSQAPTDQATGKTGTVADAIRDTLKAFQYAQDNQHTYQTWGRTTDLRGLRGERRRRGGTARRRDGNRRQEAVHRLRPDAVRDRRRAGARVRAGGEEDRHRERVDDAGDRQGAGPVPVGELDRQHRRDPARPPRSSASRSRVRRRSGRATTLCRRRPVASASSTRRAPTSTSPSFQPQLTKNGGPKLAAEVGFDPNNTQQAADAAATSIQKFKDAGVTSVVLFAPGPVVTALMTAATAQDYHPEWVFTGYGYQDYDGFARNYPQDQMHQAFGLSVLWPYADPQGLITDGFRWYWSKTQGVYSTTIPAVIAFVYGSMHYAGPTLTAENVRKGWFSVPATHAVTGQSGYGNTTGMPYPEYAAGGTDRGARVLGRRHHRGRPARISDREGRLPVRRQRQALHVRHHAEDGAEVLRHEGRGDPGPVLARTTPTGSCHPRCRARGARRRAPPTSTSS